MNAQSVRNKTLEIESYVNDELGDVSVLCVTEHFLKKDEVAAFSIC